VEECVVALDAGIGGGRSVVCDASGRILASIYREWSYDSSPTVPGASTFDAERFWLELCKATREAMAVAGRRPEAVQAISATSQREGLVLTDRDGRVLAGLSSLDTRANAENDALFQSHGDLIYRTTGHRLNSVHTPGRLEWLRVHLPDTHAAIGRIFTIDSWLGYRMSGIAATEPSSASASLLFDIQQRRWSRPVCDLVGLASDALPEVGVAGQVTGNLTYSAAQDLGLLPGTRIVLGGGDGQCGLLGLGVFDLASVGAVAGTTTPMLQIVGIPLLDVDERTWTQCHVIPDLWAVEANAGCTGLSYRWLRELLWAHYAGKTGHSAGYDEMDEAAAHVPAGADGIRVYLGTNTLDLRRCEIVQRTAAFLGMRIVDPVDATRAALVRATLESIAFALRHNWDLLHDVSGAPASVLHVGGGQVRSVVWCQILADVLNVPLRVGPPEAAALGAAMCAWVGVGRADSLKSVSRELARYSVVAPDKDGHDTYEGIYLGWLAGLRAH
jgi:sugar (pentulose or hexulose) kinase